MIVRLFDRYSKLRSRFRTGRVVDEPKEMLPFLKGKLSKSDLPAAIVEPGDLEELRATLEFAAEKQIRVAVAGGLKPTAVDDLDNHFLILTTRLSQSPVISTARRSARVSGGFPVESLAIDLAREGLDWWPLFPVPSGKSVGAMIAGGWEGLRCLRRGGLLCHLNFVEWMSFDGKAYAAGPTVSASASPDVSGLLFGSRGRLGIITGAELSLNPALKARSAALLEFTDAAEAIPFFNDLATYSPQPETVLFWGSVATEIIRQGNDDTISDLCRFTVMVEWDEEQMRLPSPWDSYARYFADDTQVRALWQDVLRLPRTATRLYQGKLETRLRFPAASIAELEEAALELGRDVNLTIAVWGTPDAGYVYLWALLPDAEQVTRQRAQETLNKLTEIAAGLGASRAPSARSARMGNSPESSIAGSMRALLSDKCDPAEMFVSLRAD